VAFEDDVNANAAEPRQPHQTQNAEVDPEEDNGGEVRFESKESKTPYPYEDALLQSGTSGMDRSWDFSLTQSSSSSATKDPAAMTSMGFFRSAPSSQQAADVENRPQTESKERLPKVQSLPRHFALLLYRNGDRFHTGKPVFIHRPPKDMKDLLTMCGDNVRVMVGPVEALYDEKLKPVRELKDVEAGGVFLLKGQEAMNPPPGFFFSGQPEGGSMRQLSAFQRANDANAQQLQQRARNSMAKSSPVLQAQAADVAYLADHGSGRLPVVRGPPPSEGRSGTSSVRREGEKWSISDTLSWQLSYGGQIGLWSGRHHDYSQWPRAPVLLSNRGSGMK
jgi:hypothetical protein